MWMVGGINDFFKIKNESYVMSTHAYIYPVDRVYTPYE